MLLRNVSNDKVGHEKMNKTAKGAFVYMNFLLFHFANTGERLYQFHSHKIPFECCAWAYRRTVSYCDV